MFSVAIDGPAGAGKSSIAKAVAKELGVIYVDTGALYRAIALGCIKMNIPVENETAVSTVLEKIRIELVFVEGTQHVLLNGKDVSEEIRTEKVSMSASTVSGIPQVRAFLLELQRGFAKTQNVIMDGRDIGTVVLPDAQVKIFLTPSAQGRAMRRTLQLEQKGEPADYEKILEDIIKRDHNDSTREIAPLKPAEDSIIVDTTDLDLEQSVNKIKELIKGRMK